MDLPVYKKIVELAEQPDAVARSTAYLTENLKRFLKKGERVLILFPKKDRPACHILDNAIEALECTSVWVGDDFRWMTLLRLAFSAKCNCIVGPPLMLLGLNKVARHMGTPLYARNVLMSGYPGTEWIIRAVEKGLDCKAWGCFDPGFGAVISGFSCGGEVGIHLRAEEYGVDIVDASGNAVPVGECGDVVLYPRTEPSVRFRTGDRARLVTENCICGSCDPRLMDLDTNKEDYESLSQIGESLHYWSSILDCRVETSECGLELEIVVFPGEKLPKLPSAAKLTIRPWDPAKDEPFAHHDVLKRRYYSPQNH